MKKILLVVESIDINDSSGSKANVALIESLHSLGYTINVLHYSRKEIHLQGVNCISIKERKSNFLYLLSRGQRVFQRICKVDLSIFLENIFGNSFTFFNDSKSISCSVKEVYKNEDLIITLSKGASFRPHHALLSLKELHSKWMAYVHDPYPLQHYPKPYQEKDKGYKFKNSFFRKVSECANYSGFPSQLLKEWMGGYYPNFLKTGIIIPHQKLTTIDAQVIKDKLPSYFDQDKFTLLHAGNLLSGRNPEFLIKAFNKFQKKTAGAEAHSSLLFIGPAGPFKKLLNEAGENVVWSQGYVSYAIVERIQNLVSVNIILEADSEISPFLPGKFPHLVKSNKKILYLGPNKSESVRLLGDEYPYKSEIYDVHKISNHIIELYHLWKKNKELKLDRENLNEYFEPSFLDRQIKRIL